MTSTRWALWLCALGAGAGIALGAGQGVSAADTETSGGAGPSSQSEDRDTSASSDATPDRDSDETPDDNTADSDDTDTSSDPATVPASVDLPDETTRDADDEPAEAATPADRDTDADTDTDTESDTVPEAQPQPTVTDEAAAQPAAAEADSARTTAQELISAVSAPVTGVKTGRATLTIPVGTNDYRTRADWYLPTQADGSVSAVGVIWLQHGFLGNKASLTKLARTLSQQTNSIVVAPNVSSFPLACAGCWINGVPMQEAVAAMFLGDRAALNASAATAGYLGILPQDFVMSGQSAGGGFATAVGGYYEDDPGNDGSLRGVVMFDGVFGGGLTKSLAKLDDPFIPVYQVAAPPQPWNASGATTKELVAARPGQFVGVTLAGGSHADALIGGNALFDFFAQLVAGFSPAGNTAAVYTLATGWINDMYQGLGPSDGTGIYGAPGEYIVMGDTAAIVLAPPPLVDIDRYLGTWYEVGSVKQFFSIGLVNTKAVYSLNPDASIKVENSGNYFFNNGPKSSIVGAALPVDPTNNRLNVRFFGPASANPPGNYWIVDLDPDYQWAIVSDPTGLSGFLLSREPVVSADFYQQLLDRASVNGVKGWITRTRQPGAGQAQS